MGRAMSRLAAIMADHDRGPEYAVVECIECDASARVEQSSLMSDAELVQRFEAQGWTITPTRCPRHAYPITTVSEPGGIETK